MPAAGTPPTLQHGTTVALAGDGVLLVGPSGSGKSDLALRLITCPLSMPDGRPAQFALVADDQTWLTNDQGTLIASCPPAIAGKLEVRGLGIVAVAAVREARLRLVVHLVGPEAVPRMPDPDATDMLAGVAVRRLQLWPFAASTPAKILMALTELRRFGL